ncbi:MAG: DUF1254 domain-containing protein [Pseudomonadota bacterium]
MISRRSVLIGGGALAALSGGAGLYQIYSIAEDVRAPLLYAFGPHEFARRIQILSGQVPGTRLFESQPAKSQYPDWGGGPLVNRELHNRELSDASSRAITTPNNDTLYTSAVLDLSAGPVELFAPDSRDRYVSIAFMDPFNDLVAYIGSRATEGRGGRFWIIGPGQSVDVPQDAELIRLEANDVWMLGRIFVAGAKDLDDARSVQSQIRVRPVHPSGTTRPFLTTPSERPDAGNFLALTNEILGRNQDAAHTARAVAFEDFGISPGDLDTFKYLPALKKRIWTRGVTEIEGRISSQVEAFEKTQTGWTTPPPILGAFGTNDEVRAGTALTGFGALTAEEAVYFRSTTDDSGALLDGNQVYRMVLPAEGVPTKAFWSISMYATSADQRFYFYENELNRYAINSHSDDLSFQPDGSIVFAFQRKRPNNASDVWMPTPDAHFKCVFRAYLPGQSILDRLWVPPPLIRKPA